MKTLLRLSLLLMAAMMAMMLTSSCSATNLGGLSFDPLKGVCVQSADGKYTACYNPLTKGITVKAAVPANGFAQDLSYDSATHSYRATLPDGTTAVYDQNGLRFEPPLPAAGSGKESLSAAQGSA